MWLHEWFGRADGWVRARVRARVRAGARARARVLWYTPSYEFLKVQLAVAVGVRLFEASRARRLSQW